MKRDGDTFTLSSGREVYANQGFLGIAPPEPGKFVEIREGYDGLLYDPNNNDLPDADPWTKEEREELAEFAIALWRAFASGARICAQCTAIAPRGALGAIYLSDGTTVHEAECTAPPLPGEWSTDCCKSCTGQVHRSWCPARTVQP